MWWMLPVHPRSKSEKCLGFDLHSLSRHCQTAVVVGKLNWVSQELFVHVRHTQLKTDQLIIHPRPPLHRTKTSWEEEKVD